MSKLSIYCGTLPGLGQKPMVDFKIIALISSRGLLNSIYVGNKSNINCICYCHLYLHYVLDVTCRIEIQYSLFEVINMLPVELIQLQNTSAINK